MLGILEQHGALCPTCRSPFGLSVSFTGTCKLVMDGTEDEGSHEYDSQSPSQCACGWLGLYGEATGTFDALPDVDGISIVGERKVRVSKEAVARFNARWPASQLQTSRAYWFEFDDNRDLTDTDVPEHSDGDAAEALGDDCKAWLFDAATPQWA